MIHFYYYLTLYLIRYPHDAFINVDIDRKGWKEKEETETKDEEDKKISDSRSCPIDSR